ncbi:unnamed protein product [Cylindrotheca closterium]|uniref:Uncharacterized protein n=1 Tax=Cylindrotheca closterium TaxID=2856 RepID=A0AAD2FHS7_9STRA|nr:unnamed protein product [Cylindrotheca closterium]
MASKTSKTSKSTRRRTRQKRSRAESFTLSVPSTFVSSDFQVSSKAEETSSSKAPKVNPERDLWNQMLNIRQIVSRMQGNLNDLANHAENDTQDASISSHFDLSKELDSFSSQDDDDDDDSSSWNTADEIINLEGILVHVISSSDSTSSSSAHQQQQQQQQQMYQQQMYHHHHHHCTDDASEAASSCVSSLGLGGHETTTPIHHHDSKSIARGNLVSPGYSDSAAADTAVATTTCTTPRRSSNSSFQSQRTEESSSSVESFTSSWQELLHVLRILYFFLLEFPFHFYSFLTDCLPKSTTTKTTPTTARSRDHDSSKQQRDKRRFLLYSLLTLFIIGCVVWNKPSPSTTTPLSTRSIAAAELSQSCVTANKTSDMSSPLLSFTSHASSAGTINSPLSSTRETIELVNTATSMKKGWNTTFADVSLPISEESSSGQDIIKTTTTTTTTTRPKNKLVRRLQTQGKKLVHKLAKNNHKMWDQYPSSVVSSDPTVEKEVKELPAPIKILQEKGQDVLRKLVKNNGKMWASNPSTSMMMPKNKQDGTTTKSKSFNSFLKRTANMWSDKPSDYYIVNNNDGDDEGL